MRVADVMTVGVLTVEPDRPLVELARLMIENNIGSLPVVENGVLVGIVCRADVLPFEEDPDRTLRTARDVMSRDLLTVTERMTVPEAARALAARGVKRAPVVRSGRLVGIVGESDLLRPYLRTDAEIAADLEEGFQAPALGIRPGEITFTVHDGAVTLRGAVRGESQRSLITRIARAVDGVATITDALQLVLGEPTTHDLQRSS